MPVTSPDGAHDALAEGPVSSISMRGGAVDRGTRARTTCCTVLGGDRATTHGPSA
jgi:hypothetical protein